MVFIILVESQRSYSSQGAAAETRRVLCGLQGGSRAGGYGADSALDLPTIDTRAAEGVL